MIDANLMALFFIEPELSAIEVLLTGNVNVGLFCCSDLDFDPITFIYELDPYSLKIHRICKCELPTSRLSKSSDIHTY